MRARFLATCLAATPAFAQPQPETRGFEASGVIPTLLLDVRRGGIVPIVTRTGAVMLRAALARTTAVTPSGEAPAECPG
jgi:hypothetical protein